MKALSLKKPLSLAVSAGATSPAGLVGAEIWSTTENCTLTWDGGNWISLELRPVGDFVYATAGEALGAFKTVVYRDNGVFLFDSDDPSNYGRYLGLTTQAYAAGDLAKVQVAGSIATGMSGTGKSGAVFAVGSTSSSNKGAIMFGAEIPAGGVYSCVMIGVSEFETGLVLLTKPTALMYMPEGGDGVGLTVYNGIPAYIDKLAVDRGGTGAKTPAEALENLGGQPKIPYGTPASSGATGNTGERSWDLENDYLSVNINSWVKMPHIALNHSVITTTATSSVDGHMVVFDGVSGRVVKGVAALSTTGNNATIPMSQLATSSALNEKINKPAGAVAGALAMFNGSTATGVLSSTSVGSTRYFIPNIDVRNEYPVPYDGVLPSSGSRTEFKSLNLSIPGTLNPVAKDAPGVVSAVPTPSGNYANITTLSPWNDPSGGMPTQLCYANNGLFIRRGVAGWNLTSMPTNSSWTASTVTSLNAIRHATAQNRTYFFFKCTTAGTTGTTEPVWPTTDGGTVVDGTVVWTAYAYWSPWNVIPTSNYASLTDLPANAYVDSTGNISRSTAVTGRRVAVPTSSNSTGVIGDWSSDENYLYVCHATNTWRRTAVSSF